MEEGEDPRTMILELKESKGEGEKGRQKSFYCIQEHDPKSVGNYKNPKNMIRTKGEMKVVNNKGYKKYYNLTNQTCSVKNDNCIFEVGKYPKCKDWSSIPCKHNFYCNMCAIRQGQLGEDVNITTMCGFCKTHCQDTEESSMPKTGDFSKRHKLHHRGNN